MSKSARPKTTSQALRTLGRIRAIEDPIGSGLLGFYKTKSSKGRKENRQEIERHLNIFKSFCLTFEKVVSFEQKNDFESLEKWLTEKKEGDTTSRIDAYIGIRSFLQDSDSRNTQLAVFRSLCNVADDILRGNINEDQLDSSVDKLEKVRKEIEEKLGPEKKTSEKILSARAPY